VSQDVAIFAHDEVLKIIDVSAMVIRDFDRVRAWNIKFDPNRVPHFTTRMSPRLTALEKRVRGKRCRVEVEDGVMALEGSTRGGE